MDTKEFTGKNVEEALENALRELNVTKEQIDYEVLEKESGGFLGLFSGKPAKIAVTVKEAANEVNVVTETVSEKVSDKDLCQVAIQFLSEVLKAMDLATEIKAEFTEAKDEIDIELSGNDMGVLIGKRGATLDSLQYLVSLVVNKESEQYIRVKVDTEDYRERRRATLENLAKNVSSKVKRTGRPYELEAMNPYERRIIHSALQDNKYVYTYSEGEGVDRHIIVALKDGVKPTGDYNRGRRGKRY